jgi:hypothetical protein
MQPSVLIFTEQQWLHNAELQMFAVTKEDIKNAHGDGFMKYAHGVKLYLQRFLDGRDNEE